MILRDFCRDVGSFACIHDRTAVSDRNSRRVCIVDRKFAEQDVIQPEGIRVVRE